MLTNAAQVGWLADFAGLVAWLVGLVGWLWLGWVDWLVWLMCWCVGVLLGFLVYFTKLGFLLGLLSFACASGRFRGWLWRCSWRRGPGEKPRSPGRRSCPSAPRSVHPAFGAWPKASRIASICGVTFCSCGVQAEVKPSRICCNCFHFQSKLLDWLSHC